MFWDYSEYIMQFMFLSVLAQGIIFGYLVIIILLPFLFFRTFFFACLTRYVRNGGYILLDLFAALACFLGYFFLNNDTDNHFVIPNICLYMFIPVYVLYSFQIDISSFNPRLYKHLGNILTVAYIKSKIVKTICGIAGLVIGIGMGAYLIKVFNMESLFWLLIVLLLGFLMPFALACLIKAHFRFGIVKQLFVLPPGDDPVLSIKSHPFFCIWLSQDILEEKAEEMREAPWHQQVKYIPGALVLVYLVFVFPFDTGSTFTVAPEIFWGLAIGAVVLTIIAFWGKKFSFIAAPAAIFVMTALVLLSGSTFGILELVFSGLVVGASVSSLRLLALQEGQPLHSPKDAFCYLFAR